MTALPRWVLASFVHPWMLRPAAEVRSLATQLDGHLARLDEVTRRANAALGPGVALGPVDEVAAGVRLARDGFAGLADALEVHGPPLASLVADAERAPRALRQARGLRRRLREHTDALSEADVACRRLLEEAVRRVPDLAAVVAGGGWVRHADGSPEPGFAPGVPSPEAGAAGIRAALAGREPDDLAAVLRTRPDLVAVLAGDPHDTQPDPASGGPVLPGRPRPGDCPQDLSQLPPGLRAALERDPGDGGSLARIVAVRDAFAALDPAHARRVALLHPRLVGGLDGAPPALRIEVNRLLVRVALGAARRTDVELEARAVARRVLDDQVWWRRLRGAALDAWLTRDRLTSFVARSSDRPLLVRRDLRIRIRLYEALLDDRGPRRLLLFDPAGRGRLAEVWGDLGPDTRHVAIFVPGTGTAVRGFHLPTRVAADLASTAGPGTAVIAWMGADFPYAIGSDAPFSRYARAAAEPLRDLVEALDLPPDATVTVVGHSYGGVMVGAAERAGLRADRVVHAASPGSGPDVHGVEDYPRTDPLGRPRDVRRWAMTARGDPIRWAQAADVPWRRVPRPLARPLRALLAPLDLGVAPTRLAGVESLEPGVWEQQVGAHHVGDAVQGRGPHAAVTALGTTAFRRIVDVVTGGDGSLRAADPPGPPA